MSSRTTAKALGHNNRPSADRKTAISLRQHRLAIQMAEHFDADDDAEIGESFWDALARSIDADNAAAEQAEMEALSAEMALYD